MRKMSLILLIIGVCLTSLHEISIAALTGNESEINANAEQHFVKANELRKLSDHDGAIIEFEKVISLSPQSKIAQNAQYWIGQSHFKTGRLDAALAAFQTLLDEHPSSRIAPSTKKMIERVEQTKTDNLLFEAVEKGDLEQLNSLISKVANVNSVKDPNGLTLLHQAARQGHADVVSLLIDKSADVNVRNNRGRRPLHYAARYGHLDVVELLLSKGAEIDAPDRWKATPLCSAVFGNHPEAVKLLLDRGANIEPRWGNRYTPLHTAASKGYIEVAELLLDRGAYIDVRDLVDRTPLHEAILRGHKEMVDLLLAHGAGVTRLQFGRSLVMMAMLKEQKEMVKFLINKGIRPYSPIHIAAFLGDLDQVKRYLADGGDIDAQGPSCQLSLLMCALYGEQRELMEFLISKGADLNLQDGMGQTVLHRATINTMDLGRTTLRGNVEIVRMLLDKGAGVNIKDFTGSTPLNWTPNRLDMEVFKLLIARGADVNTKSGIKFGDQGWTALHDVCWAGDEAKAKVLIAHGADVNAKTKTGKTPMSLAKRTGRKQIVELLRQHGAKE